MAGAEYYGFATPGHTCDNTTDDTFKGNVAHSIKGYGAAIFPNPAYEEAHAICYEGSNFAAYKATQGGIYAYFETLKL